MKVNKLTLVAQTIPDLLVQIPSPPKLLYAGGNHLGILKKPAIAIVGSRKLTPYGRQITYEFSSQLARWGFVIVSGLAIGVDGIAHQAALDAGGTTIAVLPSGLDRIYPATHHQLAKRIIDSGGLLISEYPAGSTPYPQNFIARNRLVSGLALGILITEAAEKSGTLHTANFALEQGREVFAVPGNILSTNSVGTNNLIKAGATPVTAPHDILNSLGLKVPEADLEIIANSKDEHALLTLLKAGMLDTSELHSKSGIPVETFNQTLTMLELSGRIKSSGGQWMLL